MKYIKKILKENPRVNRSRPCRVEREMEDRCARIGVGRAASRERWKERIPRVRIGAGRARWKEGNHTRNGAMFTLVTGYRYMRLFICYLSIELRYKEKFHS